MFITGNITDANPGPVLHDRIAVPMLAIGWELVDTVIIASNTHKVYKSPAAGNSRNLDWYIDIYYPTTGTSGGIRFVPFEDYNNSSHIAFRGPYAPPSDTVIEQTYYSRFGATGSALETNWAPASRPQLANALTASAFSYYFTVTRNRIIGFLTNTPTFMIYAGFYNPTTAVNTFLGSNCFPLIMTVIPNTGLAQAASASTNAAVTRLPKYSNGSVSWPTSCSIQIVRELQNGRVGVAPSAGTGEIVIVPLVVNIGSNVLTDNSSVVGEMDGLASGLVYGSATRGDTINVAGDTWYCINPYVDTQQTRTLFMKAI